MSEEINNELNENEFEVSIHFLKAFFKRANLISFSKAAFLAFEEFKKNPSIEYSEGGFIKIKATKDKEHYAKIIEYDESNDTILLAFKEKSPKQNNFMKVYDSETNKIIKLPLFEYTTYCLIKSENGAMIGKKSFMDPIRQFINDNCPFIISKTKNLALLTYAFDTNKLESIAKKHRKIVSSFEIPYYNKEIPADYPLKDFDKLIGDRFILTIKAKAIKNVPITSQELINKLGNQLIKFTKIYIQNENSENERECLDFIKNSFCKIKPILFKKEDIDNYKIIKDTLLDSINELNE